MAKAFDPGAPGGSITRTIIVHVDGGRHVVGISGLPKGTPCVVDDGFGHRYDCPRLLVAEDEWEDDDDTSVSEDDFEDDDDEDEEVEDDDDEGDEWEEVGEEDDDDDVDDEWCDDPDDDDDDDDDDDESDIFDDGPLDMVLAYTLWG